MKETTMKVHWMVKVRNKLFILWVIDSYFVRCFKKASTSVKMGEHMKESTRMAKSMVKVRSKFFILWVIDSTFVDPLIGKFFFCDGRIYEG